MTNFCLKTRVRSPSTKSSSTGEFNSTYLTITLTGYKPISVFGFLTWLILFHLQLLPVMFLLSNTDHYSVIYLYMIRQKNTTKYELINFFIHNNFFV